MIITMTSISSGAKSLLAGSSNKSTTMAQKLFLWVCSRIRMYHASNMGLAVQRAHRGSGMEIAKPQTLSHGALLQDLSNRLVQLLCELIVNEQKVCGKMWTDCFLTCDSCVCDRTTWSASTWWRLLPPGTLTTNSNSKYWYPSIMLPSWMRRMERRVHSEIVGWTWRK